MRNSYLIWLEWPEKCFRMDAEALRYLKALVPQDARVVRARSEVAFLKALPHATHAIVWNFKAEWFVRAPRLKVLATPAAGQELVPTEGPKGVRIHFGHYHGAIMAESVVAFVLGWAHGFFAVRNAPAPCRAWPRTWLSERCFDVAGTKAVILGYGNVGRAIGDRLAALGIEVCGITRHGVFRQTGERVQCGQSRILSSADWLILALPSTTGTDDILDAALLRKLPRRCVVINVGRGNSVDEKAVLAALRNHRIAGAYLDVCKHEPSGTGGDRPQGRFLGTNPDLPPNLVLMPHASAFSPSYLKRCFKELKDDRCL